MPAPPSCLPTLLLALVSEVFHPRAFVVWSGFWLPRSSSAESGSVALLPSAFILAPLQDLKTGMKKLLELFPQFQGTEAASAEGAVNALHIVLLSNPMHDYAEVSSPLARSLSRVPSRP